MKIAQASGIALSSLLLVAPSGMAQVPVEVKAQATAPARVPAQVQAPGSIEAINAEYERELVQIERARLARLGQLALAEPKDKAAVAFDYYFRLAIAKNLYADADPVALRVIAMDEPSPAVSWLAHLVHIVAQADRGDYEGSLGSFASAIRLKGQPNQPKGEIKDSGLSIGTRASIVEAYYQRLLQADQFEVARKAMRLIVENAEAPPIRDLAARRLKQLELVGKPAPEMAGVDVEGKPFALGEAKGRGEVVLVVFWASWCLPNAQEVPYLNYLGRTYKDRGLRVVGVNMDASQEGQDPKSVLPDVRRFLVDYNVMWPTLINGPGGQDYASAFGVTELPASVLVGRDGKIIHLDLMGRNLEKAVAEAVAKKP